MDITSIILLIIGLCASVITGCLIPYLVKKYGQEKVKSAMATTEQILYWVKIFVSSAEQIYSKEQCDQKKQYVVDLITKKLAELNLTVDLEALNAEIEAEVLRLHTELDNAVNTTITK